MKGRVLVVAGSDSGGGAGIQADIKTIMALGGYASTAIAALTAQNTNGVEGIFDVPPAFVAQQMRVVLDDIGADCVKTGMLGTAAMIETVVSVLADAAADVPVIVDPVMVAKGGAALLHDDAVEAMRTVLLPCATVLTPNLPEAEVLTGLKVTTLDQMRAAGGQLMDMGARAVLMKGGHMAGDRLTDLLLMADGERVFEADRIDTPHTHGTGCTTASAIAAGLAGGMPIPDAVERALAYVREAIRTAPGIGSGHGPLNHAHPLQGG